MFQTWPDSRHPPIQSSGQNPSWPLLERRRLLHERAAQAIEALFSDRLEDHLSELAHHYERSGNLRKAVEYLGRAGRLAAQQTAHSEAVAYFKRTLELLKSLPESAA